VRAAASASANAALAAARAAAGNRSRSSSAVSSASRERNRPTTIPANRFTTQPPTCHPTATGAAEARYRAEGVSTPPRLQALRGIAVLSLVVEAVGDDERDLRAALAGAGLMTHISSARG
jgi:hypothetical protein